MLPLLLAAFLDTYSYVDIEAVRVAGDPKTFVKTAKIPANYPSQNCEIFIAGAGMGGLGAALRNPEKFHGTGAFDPETGDSLASGQPGAPKAWQDVFGALLLRGHGAGEGHRRGVLATVVLAPFDAFGRAFNALFARFASGYAAVVKRVGGRIASNVKLAMVVPGSGLVKAQAEAEDRKSVV